MVLLHKGHKTIFPPFKRHQVPPALRVPPNAKRRAPSCDLVILRSVATKDLYRMSAIDK